MAAGGMNLCKWNLNSPELIQKIESATAAALYTNSSGGNVKEEDVTHVKAVMGHSVLKPFDHTSRILGMVWNSARDVFSFDFTELSEHVKTTEVTKRLILRLTAKTFGIS